jgi:hypothetical protein
VAVFRVTSDCRTWDGGINWAFRQLERLAATTFMATTGHADGVGRKAALGMRFDVHVPKPEKNLRRKP